MPNAAGSAPEGGWSAADVVVVGAGVAGLVCATEALAGGATVACLEVRERVGGRARSTAGWVDLGATWFWDGERAVAELTASLGLARYPQALAGDALYEPVEGPPARLRGNPLDAPAWRLAAGMQALPLALASRLPAGVLATGAAVEAVALEPDGGVAVATAAGGVRGRVAVLALPPRLAVATIAFTPALPPAVREAADALHTWMGDTVKAVAVFDDAFWRRAGLAGAAISHAGPFGELHDHSGPGPGQAALFGFAQAARLAGLEPGAIGAAFVDQLERLFGREARAATAVHVVDWSREPGTATPDSPRDGSYAYGPPILRAPHLEGRLAFASTETAAAFGGHVEGAILAGRRAAAQALELLAEPRASREQASSTP